MQSLFPFVSSDTHRSRFVEFWSVHEVLRTMTLDSWISVNVLHVSFSLVSNLPIQCFTRSFIYFFSGDECWKLTKKQFHIFFSLFVFIRVKIFNFSLLWNEKPKKKDAKNEIKAATLSIVLLSLSCLLLRVTQTLSNSLKYLFFPLSSFTIIIFFAVAGCLVLIISLFRSWKNWQRDKLGIGKRHKNDTCQP